MSSKNIKRKPYCLKILGKTAGPEHIEIKGCRLPTHKQVLMCLLANIKQMRLSQSSCVKPKVMSDATKEVVKQVVDYYSKAGVTIVKRSTMIDKIQKLYKKYDGLRKSVSRIDKPPDFLATTMPFLPKNFEESLMKKIKSPLLGEVEKDAAKEDLKFF